MNILNKANVLYAAAVTVLTALLGEYWFLFAAFFTLNVIDYVTGIVKARMTKTENSNKGLRGIVKKVGYWVVIAVAFFMAMAFSSMGNTIGVNLDFMRLVGWFTLATFIVNEIRSVLENLVVIGVDVPHFLIKGLSVAADIIDKETENGD